MLLDFLYLRRVWCLLVGSALMPAAFAGDATPLALSNQAPLARLYGVPAAQPARLLAPATSQWLLTSTLANTFSKDATDREAIFMDGESEELKLQWRYGFTLDDTSLELFAALPWVHHGGGFLDRSIIEFHKLFGLPQGNRTRFDNNQLRYAYREGDDLMLDFEQSGGAIGDLQLGLGVAVLQTDERALSARVYLKVPTGDADQMTGSEASDVTVALHYAQPLWGGGFDGAFGVVALGDGDVLAEKQRDYAAFGHLAWSYGWLPSLDLIAQLGANSAFYDDTGMTELDGALYLGLGTRYRATPGWAVEFSVIEDLLINSTPDVGFQLALRYRPE